jgi:hypothetical protein
MDGAFMTDRDGFVELLADVHEQRDSDQLVHVVAETALGAVGCHAAGVMLVRGKNASRRRPSPTTV